MVPDLVERCSGSEGAITLTLERVPVPACALSGHSRRWAHPDFGMLLTEQIFHEGEFPVARSGVRKLRCRRCEASLSGAATRAGAVQGDVTVAALAPFQVAISGGILTCASCGFAQADSSDAAAVSISEALANAFDAGRFEPS